MNRFAEPADAAVSRGARSASLRRSRCDWLVRGSTSVMHALWMMAFSALLALLAAPTRAATPSPREYDVKAAFLFNFASFTDWPAAAFSTPGSPFVIGIIGDDPFGPILDEIVAGEAVKGHPLIVRRLTSRQVNETVNCHILFIAQSEARRLRPILLQVRGKPVFTISDIPNFIDAGGIVAFTTDGSVRLTINPTAASHANLAISSKLLRLAQVVDKEVSP